MQNNLKKNNVVVLLSILFFTLTLIACSNYNEQINNNETSTQIETARSLVTENLNEKRVFPKIDGSTANMPMMAQIKSDYMGIPLVDAQNDINNVSTTDYAWVYLAEGKSDILLVYEPSPDTIKELGDKIDNLQICTIGVDALVFLKNKGNVVNNLTIEDLQNIYMGNITNWKELGGSDSKIEAFQRSHLSGSQTLFLKLLMKDKTPMVALEGYELGDMGGVMTTLAIYDNESNAIGYSVYYYAKKMNDNPKLALFDVNGIMANDENIENGKYPLLNKYYVAIRKDEPSDSPARKLYNYIISDEGKESIKKAGYIPVSNPEEIQFKS